MKRAFALLAVLTLGCTPSFARAPTMPTQEDLFANAEEVAAASGMDEDPPLPMQLYPGDVVTLITQSAEREELPNLRVDDRGVLHVPLAGDVQVGRMPLTEAEQRLEAALRQYDRTIRVSIVVVTADGHQASVVGAVEEPGRVTVVGGMRIADLLASVGGALRPGAGDTVALEADLGGARLMRDGDALPVSIALALEGDPRHNVRIRPGDVLRVPYATSRQVTILGQVESSTVVAYRPGLRVTEAVAMAGGVTRDGNWGDVRVLRGDSQRPRIYQAAIADIVDGRSPDVVLAPGDVVYVASAGHADLRDVMNSISQFLSLGTTAGVITLTALSTASAATAP